MEKKILMLVAPEQFRDEELLVPLQAFKDDHFHVEIASYGCQEAKGMFGAVVPVDKDIMDVKEIELYRGLVLVGGMGCLVYESLEHVHSLIKQALTYNLIVGSICISPRILLKAGVLQGKQMTMWNEDDSQREFITAGGGLYTGESVTVDGRIVTANGPQAAFAFAQAVLEKLKFVN